MRISGRWRQVVSGFTLVSFLLLFGNMADAYTEVPGGTLGNTIWGPGTVYLSDNVTVSGGATLTVEPGTVVKFAHTKRLSILGTLNATGAAPSDIVFTSIDDNSFGEPIIGSDGVPSPGDWDGIYFNGSGANEGIGNFDYCRVRYGGDAVDLLDANVYFYYSDAGYFRNSISEFSDYYGIRTNSASPEIADSMIFDNARHGLYAEGSGAATVTDNVFTDNGGYALFFDQSVISPAGSNNTGSGNALDGIALTGKVAIDQTWGFGSDSLPIVIHDSVTVSAGVTLTIPAGTVVKTAASERLQVHGTLNAAGTADDWVVFTSLKDDTSGGDTNGDADATLPLPGDWDGIYFNGSGTYEGSGNFDYCRVRYGGDASDELDANVYFYYSDSGYFRNSISEFSDYYGIRINSASPEITDSMISANTQHGLYAEGSGAATVTDNVFTDNGGYALFFDQSFISPAGSNNTGSGNDMDGIALTGTVAIDQTWGFGSASLPIVIHDSVTVDAGVTLTIPAGTVVKIAASERLQVHGTLDAAGTADDWVVFTSLKDDTYGGDTNADADATLPSPGDWDGIYFNGSGDNDGIGNFDYCRVRYGGDASDALDANVYFYYSDAGYFKNSISEFSDYYGIRINGASPEITDSMISANTQHGLYAEGSGAATVTDNVLTDNGGYALFFNQSVISPAGSNNTGSGNDLDGVALSGTVASDQTWGFGSDSLPIVIHDSVTVSAGVTLTIPAGTVVKTAASERLQVHGTLDAAGTADDWVVFTSLKDDTYGGDTNGDADATLPLPGDWDGIYFNGSGTYEGIGNFDYCRVRYGGDASDALDANVYFYYSASGYFRNSISEFSGQYGIRIYSASPEITDSTISDNTQHGLYAAGGGAATVTDNTFTGNGGYALFFNQSVISPAGSNNTGSGNALDGIALTGTVANDQTWGFGSDSLPIVIQDSVTVSAGVTLTIPAGTVVKTAASERLQVHGTLDAAGTADDWVVFTSLKDDVYGGDTNGDADATLPSPGDWDGIHLYGSGTYEGIGNFDYCRVRYGGDASDALDANVYFYYSASGYFRNSISEFSDYYGIRIQSASPEIVNSTMANNDESGVYLTGSTSTIINTIVWDNTGDAIAVSSTGTPLVVYSDIQGGYPGEGNIDTDPLFADAAAGDYALLPCSPAIDSGDPVEVLAEDYTAGDLSVAVDAVTVVEPGDLLWIFDGGDLASDVVAGVSSASITLENGFPHNYRVADGAHVFTTTSDYSSEPAPNGRRINMGAYGGSPWAASCPCDGDFEPDGDIDGVDLSIFVGDFNRTDCLEAGDCLGDFNSDGYVNRDDLEAFAFNFGKPDCHKQPVQ